MHNRVFLRLRIGSEIVQAAAVAKGSYHEIDLRLAYSQQKPYRLLTSVMGSLRVVSSRSHSINSRTRASAISPVTFQRLTHGHTRYARSISELKPSPAQEDARTTRREGTGTRSERASERARDRQRRPKSTRQSSVRIESNGSRVPRLGCVRRSAEQEIASRRCTRRARPTSRERERRERKKKKNCAIDFTSKAD